MVSLHITLYFDESRKADVIKQLEALDLGEDGRLDLQNGNGADFEAPPKKDFIQEWHDWQAARDAELEGLSWDEAMKKIFGEDHVSG